jgi:hypothetical protein
MYTHSLTSLVYSPWRYIRPRNYIVAEKLAGLYLFVPSTINANSPAFERAANPAAVTDRPLFHPSKTSAKRDCKLCRAAG